MRTDLNNRVAELLSRNGGHRPPPPNDPPVTTRTDGNNDGESDDPHVRFNEAMTAVLDQALDSNIELHRDDIQSAMLVLLTRIAVEMGNIRYLVSQATGGDDA